MPPEEAGADLAGDRRRRRSRGPDRAGRRCRRRCSRPAPARGGRTRRCRCRDQLEERRVGEVRALGRHGHEGDGQGDQDAAAGHEGDGVGHAREQVSPGVGEVRAEQRTPAAGGSRRRRGHRRAVYQQTAIGRAGRGVRSGRTENNSARGSHPRALSGSLGRKGLEHPAEVEPDHVEAGRARGLVEVQPLAGVPQPHERTSS